MKNSSHCRVNFCRLMPHLFEIAFYFKCLLAWLVAWNSLSGEELAHLKSQNLSHLLSVATDRHSHFRSYYSKR